MVNTSRLGTVCRATLNIMSCATVRVISVIPTLHEEHTFITEKLVFYFFTLMKFSGTVNIII